MPKSTLDDLPVEEIVRQINDREKTVAQLAREYGVRSNSLNQALLNRGLIKRRPRLSDEAFIEAWNASASIAEVSARTGIGRDAVGTRARQLRAAGTELKRLKRAETRGMSQANAAFIATWNAAANLGEALAALGMTRAAAPYPPLRLAAPSAIRPTSATAARQSGMSPDSQSRP